MAQHHAVPRREGTRTRMVIRVTAHEAVLLLRTHTRLLLSASALVAQVHLLLRVQLDPT